MCFEFFEHVPPASKQIANECADRGRQKSTRLTEALALDHLQMDTDIECRILSRKAHRICKGAAIGHECRCGKDAFAMSADNACVHVASEAEVIRIDNKVAQAVFLKKGELDTQEFLGVGAEVLHEALHLYSGAIEILIQRGVHQKLTE